MRRDGLAEEHGSGSGSGAVVEVGGCRRDEAILVSMVIVTGGSPSLASAGDLPATTARDRASSERAP